MVASAFVSSPGPEPWHPPDEHALDGATPRAGAAVDPLSSGERSDTDLRPHAGTEDCGSRPSDGRALAPRRQLDLRLRSQPDGSLPRFHLVKPFVEMAAYHAFLTSAGWIYGNSPLDWDPPSWDKWKYRVTHRPVWRDGDSWELNIGGHAVFGSDHYLMARNSGWSWYGAVAFTTFGSCFWEYVTEGMFEQPSAIDLVVTPILGSVLGEVRYRLFRLVRRRWGGTWYGTTLMAVLDPTTMFFAMWGWK